MTVSGSTLEHAADVPEPAMTPLVPQVSQIGEADNSHARALAEVKKVDPDHGARARMAAVLYRITGWEMFGYAELAASESAEEAEEHRRILRRRPPPTDED